MKKLLDDSLQRKENVEKWKAHYYYQQKEENILTNKKARGFSKQLIFEAIYE